jgi:hypothetical protein
MTADQEKPLHPSPEVSPKYDLPPRTNLLLESGVDLTCNNGLPATLYLISNTKLRKLAKEIKALCFLSYSNRLVAEITIAGETIHLIYSCDTNPSWLIKTFSTALNQTFNRLIVVAFNGKPLLVNDKNVQTLTNAVKLKIKPSLAVLLQSP